MKRPWSRTTGSTRHFSVQDVCWTIWYNMYTPARTAALSWWVTWHSFPRSCKQKAQPWTQRYWKDIIWRYGKSRWHRSYDRVKTPVSCSTPPVCVMPYGKTRWRSIRSLTWKVLPISGKWTGTNWSKKSPRPIAATEWKIRWSSPGRTNGLQFTIMVSATVSCTAKKNYRRATVWWWPRTITTGQANARRWISSPTERSCR